MSDTYFVVFDAQKAGREPFKGSATEDYRSMAMFKTVRVVCDAATGRIFYPTDLISSADPDALKRAQAQGAIRQGEIRADQCIHFEHHNALVSAPGVAAQLAALSPEGRERVVAARNTYLPAKTEGYFPCRKFGSRITCHEPDRLALNLR